MRRAGSRRGSSLTPLRLDHTRPLSMAYAMGVIVLPLRGSPLPRAPNDPPKLGRLVRARAKRGGITECSLFRLHPTARTLWLRSFNSPRGQPVTGCCTSDYQLSRLAGCGHEFCEVLESCYQVSHNVAKHLSQEFATKTIHVLDVQRPTAGNTACQRSARDSDGDRLYHPQREGDVD